jgi:hypothetical protein
MKVHQGKQRILLKITSKKSPAQKRQQKPFLFRPSFLSQHSFAFSNNQSGGVESPNQASFSSYGSTGLVQPPHHVSEPIRHHVIRQVDFVLE